MDWHKSSPLRDRCMAENRKFIVAGSPSKNGVAWDKPGGPPGSIFRKMKPRSPMESTKTRNNGPKRTHSRPTSPPEAVHQVIQDKGFNEANGMNQNEPIQPIAPREAHSKLSGQERCPLTTRN